MKNKTRVVGMLAVAGLTGLWLTGCETTDNGVAAEQGNTTQPYEIVMFRQVNGQDAADADGPAALLIQDKQSLDALGSQTLSAVDIPFRTRSVIVVTMGECPTGGYWIHITGVERDGDKLYVDGIANRPADDAMTTQMLTHPFAAAVIPRVEDVEVSMRIDSVVGRDPPQ